MIDFNTFECVHLEDVAEYGRAKQGHIYPRGTSTLQISASRGQIGYLEAPGEVATKDVAIIPQAGIDPKYFNIVLQKNVSRFMAKYATGINVQESEVGNFPIELHNYETQKAVAKMLDFIDTEQDQAQSEIETLKQLKRTMLGYMMI
ncbi:restriction endonuclease subunit S [Sporolactobacillus terrae]|uniref:restriction endonuclease subunit S n=1 Tax=Sporolactobacillus terrae TaxID=269673 RepID=UPI00048B93E7|nr:restriction endonuclease subunit S [Sporolactobacillus terrae]